LGQELIRDAAFKDNVVILTGASSGIGEAIAYQLADQGAWLSLAARRTAQLEHVAAECNKRGGRSIVVPTDLTNKAQCENLIQRTMHEFGRIDTLINNAGIGMWTMFENVQDLAMIEYIMRVNYLGSVYCTYYALPHLKKTRGRIIAVSSLAGKTGIPSRTGYAASKHALVGFFDSLRIEVAQYGISVTMTYPDFVASGARFRNLGGDGKPVTNAPPYASNTMTSETCAQLIIDAAAKRRREVYMSMRGKFGQWIKLILPGLIDRIAWKAIEKGD
jgi:short-subunit dehydrogenase